MNTLQIQLNERQLADLTVLLDEGLDTISMKLSGREVEHYTQAERDEITRLCCDGISAIRRAIEDKSYLWSSGSGLIELDIPTQAVDDIARPGDNEPACLNWLDPDNPNYLEAQINRWRQAELDDAREYLKDAGIDEVDEMPYEKVAMYIVWMACHEIAEG
jgi:hypothetical protein